MVIAYGLLIIFSLLLIGGFNSISARKKADAGDLFMISMCLVFILGSAQYIFDN